jgi:cation-transporting ATPase E
VQVDVDTVNHAIGMVAQSAVTTFTVLCGIILILFVDPPARFWTGGSPFGGDRRVFYLAGGMLVLYVILLVVPAFRSAFDLQPLDIADYAVIVILVIVWLFLTRWFWRMRLLERFLNIE